ncbi:TPA: hypothetical protein ACH3X3_000292 [Trebouxia sp. C0006]
MYSSTPQAKSYRATGTTPRMHPNNLYSLEKSREVVCLPFSHITGPHFIADASCAMKASSKKKLDASDRIAIAPRIPCCCIDTLHSIGHSLALNKSSPFACCCMQHYTGTVLCLF